MNTKLKKRKGLDIAQIGHAIVEMATKGAQKVKKATRAKKAVTKGKRILKKRKL